MLKILKCLIAKSSSGSNGWARVKRERTKSRERLLRTIVFDSGHLQHFAADDSRWTRCPSSEYPSTRDSVQKQVMLNALWQLTFILYFY